MPDYKIFQGTFADPGSTPGISTSTRQVLYGTWLAQCKHQLTFDRYYNFVIKASRNPERSPEPSRGTESKGLI